MAWYNAPIRWPFQKSHGSSSFGAFFPTVAEPFGMNSYQVFAFEGYKRNSTAFMCSTLIARSIANLPIKIFREVPTADGFEEKWDNTHPLHKLIGKKGNPNPSQSWLRFMEAYWAYRHISGNEYLFALGDVNMPGELMLLRPDRVKRNKNGKDWDYTVNGTIQVIPEEQMLHTRSFDPLSDCFGMPIFEAAATEIDQDNRAGAWNNALLKNGARPSMFISSPEGLPPPSAKQDKQIENWAARNLTGADNIGVAIVTRGLKLQEVGLTPKDMDWLKGMIQAKVSIANVCGVPPELIGIQEQKTYANYATALKAFYENTVLPYADDMLKSFTKFLGGKFQGGMRGNTSPVIIAVDRENVVALQENLDSKHERLRKDTDGPFLTVNEVREEVGFDSVEGGDQILVNGSRQTLEELTGIEPDNETMPGFPPVEEDEDGEQEE